MRMRKQIKKYCVCNSETERTKSDRRITLDIFIYKKKRWDNKNRHTVSTSAVMFHDFTHNCP